jgi:hypothetical protein
MVKTQKMLFGTIDYIDNKRLDQPFIEYMAESSQKGNYGIN